MSIQVVENDPCQIGIASLSKRGPNAGEVIATVFNRKVMILRSYVENNNVVYGFSELHELLKTNPSVQFLGFTPEQAIKKAICYGEVRLYESWREMCEENMTRL